jgi:flagellar motor switch protein FliG
MLTSRRASDAALRILETTLNEDLMLSASAVVGGVNTRIASIINQMERDHMDDVLQSISESEPTLAEKLKSLLFTFEDIPKLGFRARTVLLDQVPAERLILALRGTDATFRDAVLPILSARTRRMVEAELAAGDMPQRKDILRAQRAIADMVLALAEQGTIEILGDEKKGAV